jgi:hypothetical protein
MVEYYFYAAIDPLKEKIAKARASSVEEAIKTFSILKGLSENEFRKLYNVTEWPTVQPKPF